MEALNLGHSPRGQSSVRRIGLLQVSQRLERTSIALPSQNADGPLADRAAVAAQGPTHLGENCGATLNQHPLRFVGDAGVARTQGLCGWPGIQSDSIPQLEGRYQ